MRMYVSDRETGTFIEEVSSIEEGEQMIREFEHEDKIDGIYKEDFYDIVNENHCSIRR